MITAGDDPILGQKAQTTAANSTEAAIPQDSVKRGARRRLHALLAIPVDVPFGQFRCARCGQVEARSGAQKLCGECYAQSRRDCATRWFSERPLAKKAIELVNRAIRRGEIAPATASLCVDCGAQAYCYDHRDYTKPLDVVPVCRSCNWHRGPGYPYNQPDFASSPITGPNSPTAIESARPLQANRANTRNP